MRDKAMSLVVHLWEWRVYNKGITPLSPYCYSIVSIYWQQENTRPRCRYSWLTPVPVVPLLSSLYWLTFVNIDGSSGKYILLLLPTQWAHDESTTNLRRRRFVIVSSQFRRSDVADTLKCYIHMTSQDDESTTKLLRLSDILATNLRQNGDVAATNLNQSL